MPAALRELTPPHHATSSHPACHCPVTVALGLTWANGAEIAMAHSTVLGCSTLQAAWQWGRAVWLGVAYGWEPKRSHLWVGPEKSRRESSMHSLPCWGPCRATRLSSPGRPQGEDSCPGVTQTHGGLCMQEINLSWVKPLRSGGCYCHTA